MQKVSEFYWQAEKFRLMAKCEKNTDQKAMLKKMAETWENLAKERETQLMMQRLNKPAHSDDTPAPSSDTIDTTPKVNCETQ